MLNNAEQYCNPANLLNLLFLFLDSKNQINHFDINNKNFEYMGQEKLALVLSEVESLEIGGDYSFIEL